jgi:uncharacterized cupredoxin-like copper-binding protein
MFRPLPVAALVTAALAAIGCSAGSQNAPAASVSSADTTVVARDVAFDDPPREIPAGRVTLAIDNRGSAHHDLTIESASMDKTTVASARGGHASAGTVTLDPGDYVVYCSVSGHRQGGMEFEVTAR